MILQYLQVKLRLAQSSRGIAVGKLENHVLGFPFPGLAYSFSSGFIYLQKTLELISRVKVDYCNLVDTKFLSARETNFSRHPRPALTSLPTMLPSVTGATSNTAARLTLIADPHVLRHGQRARQHRCGMTDAIRDKTLAEGSGADPKPRPKLLAVNCFYANTMHAVAGLTGCKLPQPQTRTSTPMDLSYDGNGCRRKSRSHHLYRDSYYSFSIFWVFRGSPVSMSVSRWRSNVYYAGEYALG